MELNKKIIRFYLRFILVIWLIYRFFKDFKFKEMKKIAMKGIYLVNLYPESTQLETFNDVSKNLLEVGLQTEDKKIMTRGFKVEFKFTKNGMLGFGTELIRQAIDVKQNGLNNNPIFKLSNSLTNQETFNLYRGVYLTPTSAELVVKINESLNFNKINNFQPENRISKIFKKEKHNNSVIENYLIDLYPDPYKQEEFEIKNENLLEIRIQQIDETLMQKKNLKFVVYLSLTADELLEFGEKLIRKVNDAKRSSLYKGKSLDDLSFVVLFHTNEFKISSAKISLGSRFPIKNLATNYPDKLKEKKINWQKHTQLNYVSDISDREITLVAQSKIKKKNLKSLGGHKSFFSKNTWYLLCGSDQDLATKLQQLRNLGFMFSYGRSWNSAEVFCYLRDKGHVKGSALRISWRDKNIIIIDKI